MNILSIISPSTILIILLSIGCIYFVYYKMHLKIVAYREQLEKLESERQQQKTEMKMASRIQQCFLPRPIELPPCVDLAAELHQSKGVGGDLYDFFLLGDQLYFAIGDVSGKGVPAALYMTFISKLFHYVAHQQTSTATICNILNEQMCKDSEEDIYATIFIGILDLNTGFLTYTNAGHTYPLSLNSKVSTDILKKTIDCPIGILENHYFGENTYYWEKGASLLFYTDGITDAEDPSGHFYSKERLVACIEQCAQKTSQEVIMSVMKEINTHISTHHQSDDLTLLMLKYTG